MAMKMRMQNVSRASSRAVVRRTAPRRLAVSVNAHQSRSPVRCCIDAMCNSSCLTRCLLLQRNFTTKVAPAMLAALVSLTAGFTPLDIVMPSPVHAEEQEDEVCSGVCAVP
jgi:hypothetical protein